MYKFKQLVINEFVKLYRSKLALTCLIILAALVLMGIVLSTDAMIVDSMYWEEDLDYWIEDYEITLQYLEDPQEIADMEFEISFLKDMKKNGYQMNGWLYEMGIYRELYRTKTYEKENTAKIAQYQSYLAKDGFTRYCEDRLKEQDLLNDEKWKYETYLEYKIDPDDKRDFRVSLIDETVSLIDELQTLEAVGATTEKITKLKNDIACNQYRIKEGIATNVAAIIDDEYYFEEQTTFWGTMYDNATLLVVVGIFCIIAAGRIVANEFVDGTYKLLVLNPVKRGKILFSKYVTVLLFGLLLSAAIFFTTAILGALRFGGTMFDPLVRAEDGVIKTYSPLWHLLLNYLCNGVQVMMMATLSFCFSALLRSQGAAIGCSLVCYLMGEMINSMLAMASLDLGRFTFFANWDLRAIANGRGLYIGQSVPFALIVLAVHLFVFLLIAYDAFVRREL